MQLVGSIGELLDHIYLIIHAVLVLLGLGILRVGTIKFLSEDLAHDRNGMLPVVQDMLPNQLQYLILHFRQIRLNGTGIHLGRVELLLYLLARLGLVLELQH